MTDMHSGGTTAEAVKNWPNLDLTTWAFENIRQHAPRKYVSGSGVQSYLEGLEFRIKGKWYKGHITLSPHGNTPWFDSAHLTLTVSEVVGNYFFDVDASGADPGNAPKKFKGKFSKNGAELPKELRDELVTLITIVAGTRFE